MAAGATVYVFDVNLSDVDRGVYETLSLRVAQHPSETFEFMLTRVLAYCLEYEEGIDFGAGGIASTEEPAVIVRDLTGAVRAWIEVGAPAAERLHYGSRLADRTAVYTHRDPEKVRALWAGKQIHQASAIMLRSFSDGLIDQLVPLVARRNAMTVSVMEGHVYIELNGVTCSANVIASSAQD